MSFKIFCLIFCDIQFHVVNVLDISDHHPGGPLCRKSTQLAECCLRHPKFMTGNDVPPPTSSTPPRFPSRFRSTASGKN
ncbi:hypothetical protein QC761_0099130 [Podospora bellae-mahoneyi]|uniref:Secreted protein n=1 Tax=Podospora bellae-mahoneyi TaxID=2093777 RepID=A0ABR0FDH8_9PEZI|nr:hypothetical protein QC761_0099130 [Podospora bellae-mahoneyi]